MLITNTKKASALRRIIEDFHKTRAYLTKVVILLATLIFVITTIITYHTTLKYSNEFVLGILIVPGILTILSVIASFTLNPRFLFVLAILLGIDAGAMLRYFLISG